MPTRTRTSATTGQGIEELRRELESLCSRVRPAADAGIFRMAIDRSFTVAGHGTVVTGTVVSGEAAVGDELEGRVGEALADAFPLLVGLVVRLG